MRPPVKRVLTGLVFSGLVLGVGWMVWFMNGWWRCAYQTHIDWGPLEGPGAWRSTAQFDAELWRSVGDWSWDEQSRKRYERRFAMLADLLYYHLRPGMDRDQVVALLGPSFDDTPPSSSLLYLLGYYWDLTFLRIKFDDRNCLCECEVYDFIT